MIQANKHDTHHTRTNHNLRLFVLTIKPMGKHIYGLWTLFPTFHCVNNDRYKREKVFLCGKWENCYE